MKLLFNLFLIFNLLLAGSALAGLAEAQSDQQTSVELSSDLDSLDTQDCVDTAEANPFEVSFEGEEYAQSCCKICRKGKACGNSCISRSKTCHKGKGCACDG